MKEIAIITLAMFFAFFGCMVVSTINTAGQAQMARTVSNIGDSVAFVIIAIPVLFFAWLSLVVLCARKTSEYDAMVQIHGQDCKRDVLIQGNYQLREG